MEAVKAVGLTKKYKDVTAVDHLDLSVGEGELLALLGVNGAGKTTTVRMLSCLSCPTEGEAFVCGHSVTEESSAVKSVIGVSPQETAVAPNLSVRENLEFLAGVYGISKAEREKRISELSLRLGLKEVEKRKAGKLSGGWQRRLSIAMALLPSPKVLFLDEPTLGLDVLARAELWELVRELKGHITVILTTHYMEEAEALSDRVAIMKDGCLLGVDTVAGWKEKTGTERLEEAFIAVVKGEGK